MQTNILRIFLFFFVKIQIGVKKQAVIYDGQNRTRSTENVNMPVLK